MSKIKAVIAMGFFDGVHKGHKAVLESALRLAEKLSCTPVAFTFDGNLKGKLYGEKCIMTREENYCLLKNAGFNEIFLAPVTDEFLSLSPREFLKFLDGVYDVKGYVFGEDYRFGKCGTGDVKTLIGYAEEKSTPYAVENLLEIDGEKVSSTKIKSLLNNGKISAANDFLGYDYFVTGKVFKDRNVGSKIGFPTINLTVDAEKSPLKNAVYAGYSVVGGKKYKAIINYGARPTYDLTEKLIEAHLIGFSGDLYGKTAVVNFTHFIRDIKKFDGEEQLKNQLYSDKKFAEENVR